jgi:succinate dehydrogenase / fumarate reductase flavoprotein subunit
MAIGEAACGSMPEPIGSDPNSLLDIVLFGRAAANRAKESLRPSESHAPLPTSATERAIDRIRWSKGKTGSGAIRLAMQRTMQRHCAVFPHRFVAAGGSG